ARKLGTARPGDTDYWLCPIDEDVAIPCLASPEREGEIEFKRDVPPTVHLYRGGTVPVTLEQYLKILDWTGRQVRAGKPGAISPDVAPILERMGISADGWYELTTSFRDLFSYAAGAAEAMAEFAEEIGRRWFHST